MEFTSLLSLSHGSRVHIVFSTMPMIPRSTSMYRQQLRAVTCMPIYHRSFLSTSFRVSSISTSSPLSNNTIKTASLPQNRLNALTRQFATTANMSNNNDSFKLENVFNVLVVMERHCERCIADSFVAPARSPWSLGKHVSSTSLVSMAKCIQSIDIDLPQRRIRHWFDGHPGSCCESFKDAASTID